MLKILKNLKLISRIHACLRSDEWKGNLVKMATAKQQHNRKKFTKEYKVKEIQKSITKKTRLRKNYLKALKEEGYDIPDKKPESKTKLSVRELKQQHTLEGKRKIDEKKEIIRERKRAKRVEAEERRAQQLENIKMAKAKQLEREKRSQKLTQKTRRGQPLMGTKNRKFVG
ncbi:hypothetical protein KAFR_0D00910 [Kazachstania africana CBS 2517]|uniref:rRNA-processing protein FYV7 n=1 Tax=Kazachstania africana (strain ATCC 22294 / BCRC 22015 / CBS 2517 / CECT 1963 / NBRC 1671 / NRRL Y-8276) TaxID=1071382 RepID=H2ATN8_KAZAF|nr:hypothetical protein KAFR_0D00910 [Kazachstania africana CBS 2517]CCF57738.1 hypothetical protein KAFR_0D00910 [Kazachstania africana CBS 2517]